MALEAIPLDLARFCVADRLVVFVALPQSPLPRRSRTFVCAREL